jgi:hypothetical protein
MKQCVLYFGDSHALPRLYEFAQSLSFAYGRSAERAGVIPPDVGPFFFFKKLSNH